MLKKILHVLLDYPLFTLFYFTVKQKVEGMIMERKDRNFGKQFKEYREEYLDI